MSYDNEGAYPPPSPVRIRVRVNHERTAKGWRCADTTVELSDVHNRIACLKEIHETLTLVLQEVHDVGTQEALRRNHVEGIPL